MKKCFTITGASIVLLWIALICAAGPNDDRATTVFIVRHAEKDESASDRSDPPLSEAGQLRAKQLAHVLKDSGIAAAYVTPFKRSRETADPVATQAKLTSTTIDAADINGLVADIQTHHAGETVLIVAHSNTTSEIVAKLSGQNVPAVSEREFDNLYVITKRHSEASVLHLRYGSAN
jgi:2,3-bisphosphoglycerate-dependent phosphoglycerate mutase